MLFSRSRVLLAAAIVASQAGHATAQDVERVRASWLQEVMPEADRFDPADGDPPVKRAYRGDELIGWVFLTSDMPPEENGYSGPITSLVGVAVDGKLTGVRATEYRESRRYEWGDFLDDPVFLGQFPGKDVSDHFGIRGDIDGISGVTITVRAMSRTLRDAARKVMIAYSPEPFEPLTEEEVLGLSWYEMRRRGIAVTMSVRQERRNPFDVSLVHMSSEALGQYLVGDRWEALTERIEEAGGADIAILYAVNGDIFVPQLRSGWWVEQGGVTREVPSERVVTIGSAAGALRGESSQVGALLLDADQVDIAAALTFALDRGRPDLGTSRVDYTSWAALVRVAEAAEAERAAEREAEASASAAPTPVVDATPEPEVQPVLDAIAAEATAAPTIAPEAPQPVDVVQISADEMFEPEPVGPPWSRVGMMVFVLALACLAFFTKKTEVRWVSLAATMVVLGWIDGGFLSISHVTGLVWVGFSAIGSDLPLLILTSFTVATVVLWGRVFCGYLCPFGALQDFIERLVPRRFKKELPPAAHRAASKVKYLVLVAVVGAAILGVQVSLYQYVEPFGTVFFLSTNVLLWTIALGFLVASAVIPRFYCRYVCPLGALLAVGSLVSLRRIRRVEQCSHCHVCEQKCPTRAIRGAEIDFGECVRCNVCEIQLIEKHGVCRHDMDEIRPRLVQIRKRHEALQAGGPVRS
jgi:NosR/NirI family nitrous oxide reductase transcriptional regulator